MPWTWIFIVGVVLVTLVGDGDPVDGVETLINTIERGARLTRTAYGKDGVIRISPDQLAGEAGADLDSYALARMVSSEHGKDPNLFKAAIAHVAVNYAASVGRSISGLLLRAVNPEHTGWFGTQRDIDQSSNNYNASDRYASTALDPYAGDLEIARAVLVGAIPDPTGGAIQFDAPSAFKTPEDAARTAAKRIAAGRVQVYPDGIDPDRLRFWA